jgi:hypothetical protein
MSGIPAWAVKGAKVVCVEPNPWWSTKAAAGVSSPVRGGVYTIRAVHADAEAILVEELHNPNRLVQLDGGHVVAEPCFAVWRFRPVVRRESDGEIEATLFHLRGLKVTGSQPKRERA